MVLKRFSQVWRIFLKHKKVKLSNATIPNTVIKNRTCLQAVARLKRSVQVSFNFKQFDNLLRKIPLNKTPSVHVKKSALVYNESFSQVWY